MNRISIIIVAMGIMLYSACSVDKDENETMSQPDFQISVKALDSINDVDAMPIYCNGVFNGCIDSMDTANLVNIVYKGCVYYFDSDSLLYQFCMTNDLQEMYQINHNLDLIYKKAVMLGIDGMDIPDIEDVPEAMKSYWKEIFGSNFGTLPSSLAPTKLTWTTTAYNYTHLSGTHKTCYGPTYWSLGDFNSKTSSFRIYNTGIGGVWWCHKRWYGKPRSGYFILGIPIGQIDFETLKSGDDNKFCSYCTTIH